MVIGKDKSNGIQTASNDKSTGCNNGSAQGEPPKESGNYDQDMHTLAKEITGRS